MIWIKRKGCWLVGARVAASLALLASLVDFTLANGMDRAKSAFEIPSRASAEATMPELTDSEEARLVELERRRDELITDIDFSRAAETQCEVTKLLESRLGPTHWRTVAATISLRELAHYQKLPLEQRQAICSALALMATGEALVNKGDYNAANACLETAAKQFSAVGPTNQSRYVRCRGSQARCAHKRLDLKRAKQLYTEVVELDRQLYGANHVQYAWALHRMGIVQMELREFDEARRNLSASARIFADAMGEGCEHEIVSNCYLAVLELRAGQPVLAELAAKDAFQWLTTSQLPEDPRQEVTQLYAIALLLATKHNLQPEAETILEYIVGLEAGPIVPPATIAVYEKAHAYVLMQLGKERDAFRHSLKGARLQNQAKSFGK